MCTPIVIDTPNGVPMNGGQALPEDTSPIGSNTTASNPELETAGAGDPHATAAPGKDDTPTGADTTGPKGSGDPITDQNTLLINSLTTLAHTFTDTTAGILQGQKDASDALTSGFLNLSDQQQKALDAANQLRQNTGQQARKPSYSLSMAKVQRASSQGAASTMLTGATGVPTNQLALGRAQLLGGAAA